MTASLICRIILLVLLGLPLSVTAATYKWVDENGNVTYSASPPPKNVKAERVKIAAPPSTDPEQAMQAIKDRAKSFSERQNERTKSAEKQVTEKKEQMSQKERCEQLKKNLDVMTSHPRIQKQNEKGEYIAMDDQQRLDTMEKTKKVIAIDCTPAPASPKL